MNARIDEHKSSGSPELVGDVPDSLAAIVESAQMLNSTCSFDAADDLLAHAMTQRPQDALLVEAHAELALQRGDWHEASYRASTGRARFPGRAASYRYGLEAEYELMRLEQAGALQRQSESLFPHEIWPLTLGARLAEARDDSVEADDYWGRVATQFPADIRGWVERAGLRLRAGRLEAAAEVLNDAIPRFPEVPDVFIAHARLARASGMLAESAQRWEAAVQRFPDNPLIAQQHADVPADVPRNKRWDLAAARYEDLHRKFPAFAFGYVKHVMLLVRSGDIVAAERVAVSSLDLLRTRADHGELTLEYAKVVERRGDAERAVSIISELKNELPNFIASYVALSSVLSRLSRFDEAEAVCEEAISRFKFRAAALVEYARLATQRGRLVVALERWSHAAKLVPRDQTIVSELHITRLAIAESGDRELIGTAMGEIGKERRSGSITNLMMQFESLGGPAGGGCEFGLVQRNFGAEPIGLLRWASLDTQSLLTALRGRFEGMGSTEHTVLATPGVAIGDLEYQVRNTRFNIVSHTFVKRGEVDERKLFEQCCARLSFLARKLVKDLETGKKIFVCRPGASLTQDAIFELSAAMRSYGKNLTLLIQTEDENHRNGTVHFAASNVMIGYIDRLNWDSERAVYQPSYSSWARICAAALALRAESIF